MSDGPTQKFENLYNKKADELIGREKLRFDKAQAEIAQGIADKLQGKEVSKEKLLKLSEQQEASVKKQEDLVASRNNWTIGSVDSPQKEDQN